MIIDDFLPKSDYSKLKKIASTCKFEDVKSPFDGAVYPCIYADIPDDIAAAILHRLCDTHQAKVVNSTIFMRMSPAGVRCPHIVHHDKVMGDYSLMLYLNSNPGAGTSMVRHIDSGISYAPALQEFVGVVVGDQNNPSAWAITATCQMAENRGFVFDAGNLHCAEPVGGFGSSQEDARIVLTVFYGVDND